MERNYTIARRFVRAATFVVIPWLWGCTALLGADATVSEGDGPGAPGAGDGDVGPPQPGDEGFMPDGAGPLPLRLLTRSEYEHSVRDILGVTLPLGASFPPEITGTSGFHTVGSISPVNVREYMLSAEAITAEFMPKLGELVPCAAGLGLDDACADTVLQTLGRRLLRHPLTADDTQEFTALYDLARNEWGYSPSEGARVMVSALLLSPFFLYRWELDGSAPTWNESDELIRLSPFQLASRLSYFLWQSAPDELLLAAAEGRGLTSEDGVAEQVTRMLADEKAERSAASFHLQWLHLDRLSRLVKNEARYPAFNDALKAAMISEVEDFAAGVLLGDGTLLDVFSQPLAAKDALLVALYADSPRAGVLSSAAFLSAHSDLNEGNPILRGKVIREQVLCQTLVAPPPGIPTLAELDATVPMRERLTDHVSKPECSGCHQLTDPIGFGFGNFDAIGQFQATDQGAPIDASGAVNGLDGNDPTFAGVTELSALLGQSEMVQSCVVSQWLRYALGRKELASEDAELAQLAVEFRTGGGHLKSLMSELATSRPFLYRAPNLGESP